MRVCVTGISVWGPGLEGWARARAVLRGEEPHEETERPLPVPPFLAPNERRRTSAVVRLALEIAREACAQAQCDGATLSAVFSSSNGDGAVLDSILHALCTPGEDVSPTQFHNSVHNAPAGYWTIGQNSIQPATAIGLYDGSFGGGLLKAAAEAVVEGKPVLLCVYDRPVPGPIGTVRHTQHNFGVGLVLDPISGKGTNLEFHFDPRPCAGDWPRDPALRRIAEHNPAARSLPLLTLLAQGVPGNLRVDCGAGHLVLSVQP
ncbi:beta-ketoacyl synthase chain length factor [Kozakia baliensis]|uniref:beta-ketoacyl synthase chain length factor n=1 Tax=Kozakia baliensis TaxID=153496 RepID=UPI0008793998|nr:beta-ketoacyl synthase chain length factor [Kozakia baliensis]AOX19098.1 hypothetical protein A0U90_00985 [Kozakia baliensis]